MHVRKERALDLTASVMSVFALKHALRHRVRMTAVKNTCPSAMKKEWFSISFEKKPGLEGRCSELASSRHLQRFTPLPNLRLLSIFIISLGVLVMLFLARNRLADTRSSLRSVLSQTYTTIQPQTIPSPGSLPDYNPTLQQPASLSTLDQQRLSNLEQRVNELHARMDALDEVLSQLQHILEQPRSPTSPSSPISEYSFTTNNTWSFPSPSVVAGQRSSLYPKRSLGSPSFGLLEEQDIGTSQGRFNGEGLAWTREGSSAGESDSDSDSTSDNTTVSSIGSMGRHYEMVR